MSTLVPRPINILTTSLWPQAAAAWSPIAPDLFGIYIGTPRSSKNKS